MNINEVIKQMNEESEETLRMFLKLNGFTIIGKTVDPEIINEELEARNQVLRMEWFFKSFEEKDNYVYKTDVIMIPWLEARGSRTPRAEIYVAARLGEQGYLL